MKECKCERRLSDPLDPPSEETMQRACDVLEHHLKLFRELNRKSKPIEVTEEHIKIINRFMEEKKTKKMTKAEAFEYLSNKKIDASINEREVQLKLFSLGVVWCTLDSNPTLGVYYLLIDEECHMTHCGCDLNYYKTHRYEEISADDILSIEIVEEKKNELELEFSYDKVVELAKPLMHYLDEVGCQDSIRISQFCVVLEPMSTLIFDNGIGE